MRIGIVPTFMEAEAVWMRKAKSAHSKSAGRKLEAAGAELVEVELPERASSDER